MFFFYEILVSIWVRLTLRVHRSLCPSPNFLLDVGYLEFYARYDDDDDMIKKIILQVKGGSMK